MHNKYFYNRAATDIYVPMLPFIAKNFNTTMSRAELTVTVNLVSSAFFSLLFGMVADCFGRKKAVICGMFIFVLGSFVCYVATDMNVLTIGRLLQGFGGGIAVVANFAAVTDTHHNIELNRALSVISVFISLSPAIAPIIGSIIAEVFNWRVIFLVILAMSIISLLVCINLQETHNSCVKCRLNSLIVPYCDIWQNKKFRLFFITQTLSIASLWGEIAYLPFIFLDVMKIKAFNYCFVITFSVCFYIVGSFLNRKLIRIIECRWLLFCGVALMILTSIILLVAERLIVIGPIMFVLLKAPGSIGLAFININSMAGALNSVNKSKGAALALMESTPVLAGGLYVYLICMAYDTTIRPLYMMQLIIFTFIIFLCLKLIKNTKRACD